MPEIKPNLLTAFFPIWAIYRQTFITLKGKTLKVSNTIKTWSYLSWFIPHTSHLLKAIIIFIGRLYRIVFGQPHPSYKLLRVKPFNDLSLSPKHRRISKWPPPFSRFFRFRTTTTERFLKRIKTLYIKLILIIKRPSS